MVAGAIFFVKVALMALLAGTSGVGPGIVVTGLVIDTWGRVKSAGAPTVVNCQVTGPAIAVPSLRLVAPVSVPVYTVPAAKKVPGVSVKVAIVFVESRVTMPVAFTQGAAHETVRLAAPVIGATGSFSVAVICVVLVGTRVAPLAGVSAITAGTSMAVSAAPKILSCPPQPAASAQTTAIAHVRHRGRLSMMFMGIPYPMI
jgi:hypothetical protein